MRRMKATKVSSTMKTQKLFLDSKCLLRNPFLFQTNDTNELGKNYVYVNMTIRKSDSQLPTRQGF